MQNHKYRGECNVPRALVTGGAGFIGSHLSEALLSRGYQVTVIDDLSTGSYENLAPLILRPGFQFVSGSVTGEDTVDSLVRECDVIFHLAAAVGVELIVKDPLRVIETNILGTHCVLKAANRYHKKVLIASTSEIYGKAERVPFAEDDDRHLGPTTKARWSYAASKEVDEFLAFAYHRQERLPVVLFRLFNTVGPRQSGQYGMVLPRFVQQALLGQVLTVYGNGLQSRCFCDVEDVVRAIIGLAESQEVLGQVFNIGSTREVKIIDLARMVIKLVDELNGIGTLASSADTRITLIPYEKAYGEGFEDMRRRIPDISRIRTALGWEPRVPLEETLRRVAASYRAASCSGQPGNFRQESE